MDNATSKRVLCKDCKETMHIKAQWKHRNRGRKTMSPCERRQKKQQQRPNNVAVPTCACEQLYTSARAARRHKDLAHYECPCGKQLLTSRKSTHAAHCVIARQTPAIASHRAKTAEAISRARDIFNTTQYARVDLREQYAGVLGNCKVGTPIAAAEYLSQSWKKSQPAPDFILCSQDDARRILDVSTPSLPILIPPEPHIEHHRLSMAQYLSYLKTTPEIDVHDFNQERSDGHFDIPKRMESAAAIDLFEDASKGPVNLLNLGRYKQNPVPPCLSNLIPYQILESVKEQPESGKRTHVKLSDLSECTAFHLCAKRGALSLAHMDHLGMMATIFNDDGEKLWPFWPGADPNQWATSGELPSSPPCALYLYPGCTLIQPPGTIHAPFSMTDVLMTGTMHWDSRNLLQVMKLSKLSTEFGHVTNEGLPLEFLRKACLIENLWRRGDSTWPWPPPGQLEAYVQILEVRKAIYSMIQFLLTCL